MALLGWDCFVVALGLFRPFDLVLVLAMMIRPRIDIIVLVLVFFLVILVGSLFFILSFRAILDIYDAHVLLLRSLHGNISIIVPEDRV